MAVRLLVVLDTGVLVVVGDFALDFDFDFGFGVELEMLVGGTLRDRVAMGM